MPENDDRTQVGGQARDERTDGRHALPHQAVDREEGLDPELDALPLEPAESEDPVGSNPELLDPADPAIDHALIRRAQAGDHDAFGELVGRHQGRAWRVARNMVRSDEDAADVAQEAFVRVFKSLASFDFQHGFTTWLYRIVTNLAIDQLRRRRPTSSTTRVDEENSEFELEDERGARPSDELERGELADEVHACLAALAPHFQSVLVLREMEGLACTEIARIVGATHVTVRWRLHRGRKLFQDEWERRARLREGGANPDDSSHVRSAGASDVDES